MPTPPDMVACLLLNVDQSVPVRQPVTPALADVHANVAVSVVLSPVTVIGAVPVRFSVSVVVSATGSVPALGWIVLKTSCVSAVGGVMQTFERSSLARATDWFA